MNLTNKVDDVWASINKGKIKKIFFYRVCGTGMGAAACLLQEQGFRVTGGDINFAPPMDWYLKKSKIDCYHLDELDDGFYKEFDLIVVGNVVPRNSKDATKIEKLGVPYISFPSVIGGLVLKEYKKVVGISGTHGKTTTTYLFTQVFEKLDKKSGYFIGGVLDERPSSKLGDGEYFFIESDEYDCAYFEKISKFRKYYITDLILTSLEFDHGDIFDSLEDIKKEFEFILTEKLNSLIANVDYDATVELLNSNQILNEKSIIRYGDVSSGGGGPVISKMEQTYTEFKLLIDNKWEEFKTNLVGRHNIYNLSSVILFASKEKFELNLIRKSVLELSLVKRRQEEKGSYKGAIIIDDFAHHPRAILATLESIKIKYPGKKIVVLFEPTSATARSDLFQRSYPDSFQLADQVAIVKPEVKTTAINYKNLDCKVLSEDLIKLEIQSIVLNDLRQIMLFLSEVANSSTLVLVMSNGNMKGLWSTNFKNEVQ